MASKATFQIVNGTLGADPELRYTTSGKEVCSISIAHNTKWKGQDGRENEKTDWFYVKLFGKLATLASTYLSKGSRVYLEGNISTSKYEKNGATVYSTDLIADKIIFLSVKKENEHRSEGYPPGYDNTHSAKKPDNSGPQAFMSGDSQAFVHDDIPF